jgi:hypothetical protein
MTMSVSAAPAAPAHGCSGGAASATAPRRMTVEHTALSLKVSQAASSATPAALS